MVAITVAISATVYVYVSGMIGATQEIPPVLSFVRDDDCLIVIHISDDLNWTDIEITGDNLTGVTYPATGEVRPGDQIKEINPGRISISANGFMLATYEF